MIEQKLTSVHMGKVSIEGPIWAQWMKVNRERTIPHEYKILKDSGYIDSLTPGWRHSAGYDVRYFGYSTIYKWLEAACYSLMIYSDAKLEAIVDELADKIVKRQEPDGFIPSSYKDIEPETRWVNLRDGGGSLYTGGHFIEAAVAHFEATGSRKLLDAACRFADLIDTVIGDGPGKKRGYPGHEEIELALMRLYRATEEKRYARLAKFFVDERGKQPHYFDMEAKERNEEPAPYWAACYYDREAKATGRGDEMQPFWEAPNLGIGAYMFAPVKTVSNELPYEYNQAHVPVREQDRAVGHAVRATYLYAAMADVAAEYGDEELRAACDRLWENLTSKQMYITGGIGPSQANEGFTQDYDLPNETAYAETCAAIGFVFWAHRMLEFECDGRYTDIMERILYNGLLSGLSLNGELFNYVNPLKSLGKHHRQPWFDCPCCPPNIVRLIASLGSYFYSQSETDAIVHMYAGGTAALEVGSCKVELQVETQYPWDGKVAVTVKPDTPASFGLKLRIPGWCPEFGVKINGAKAESLEPQLGYIRIEREWKDGDRVELDISMPVNLVGAHPNVRDDIGCLAIERGPLVYCIEQVDTKVSPDRIVLPENAKFDTVFEKNLLGGVVVVHGDAFVINDSDWDGELYRVGKQKLEPFNVSAIPYYAWDNRDPGEMRVWLRTDG
jgi:uncharacterized protein